MHEPRVPDVVCTLTTKDLASQALEWRDLAPLATSRRRLANGAESTYPLEHADRIEDLASREMACCGSWLSIRTERTPTTIVLEVTTQNPDGVDIILSMSGFGSG